jgi:hypothetical protein
MANLFWKKPAETKSLLETPFKTEEEFEKIVFGTPEVLEDIFLIQRQVRGGKKRGIPDIVGIDNDGNVCIIEMKNAKVDQSILPQVLKYAIWAETNPDAVKNLWLECENKPEDLSVNWDNYGVRIIIMAPNIIGDTSYFVSRLNFPVDLIEVRRWVEGDDQLLLVSKLDEEVKAKAKPASGLVIYDENFYKKEYNKKSVDHYFKYIKDVERIIKKEGWDLYTKHNKSYCGFKAGFFNAFGIKWLGTKTFAFFFKLSKEEAKKIPLEMTRYEEVWKEAVYSIKPGETKTSDFRPLFEMAYKKLAGR